jgi:hypothetical protein
VIARLGSGPWLVLGAWIAAVGTPVGGGGFGARAVAVVSLGSGFGFEDGDAQVQEAGAQGHGGIGDAQVVDEAA